MNDDNLAGRIQHTVDDYFRKRPAPDEMVQCCHIADALDSVLSQVNMRIEELEPEE